MTKPWVVAQGLALAAGLFAVMVAIRSVGRWGTAGFVAPGEVAV